MIMNNKKTAITVTVFIIVFLTITAVLGISGHIPFLGKALSLVFAVILIIFVIGFFIIIGKNRK